MKRPVLSVVAMLLGVVAVLLTPAPGLAQDAVLDLPVGDPERRDKTVALLLDGIVDTHDGAVLSPSEVAERLDGVRILFFGESHTSIDFHRAQYRMIEALLQRGRSVMVGLEMYPADEQPHLDGWINGEVDEAGFLATSRWYENWGYNWEYYRDIFVLSREHGVPMFALNAPRHVVSAVRSKGIDGLSPEEAAYMPPSIDTDNADHLRLFKSYFGDDDPMHSAMSDEQWNSMFAAQCTWDAAMGYNAVQATRMGDDDAIMVVLIGSGHVSYGLGIERQAGNFFDGRTASLIPVAVEAADGHRVSTVRASFADFVWGVPGETAPLYPGFGLSTRAAEDADGLNVIFVQDDTPGGRAGIHTGDRLLTLDGTPLPDNETYKRLVAAKRWGDRAVVTLARGEETLELTLSLRRDPS